MNDTPSLMGERYKESKRFQRIIFRCANHNRSAAGHQGPNGVLRSSTAV